MKNKMENNPKVSFNARSTDEINQENELLTALYCRTALACDTSIADQEYMLRQYAEKNGYSNIAVYSDNGFVGSNLDRPAMQQLQADAEAGILGRVLVKDVARISRSIYCFCDFLDFMADMGIAVNISTGNFTMSDDFYVNLEKRQEVYQQFLKTKKRAGAV